MAYRQSLVTEPEDDMTWSELLNLYRQQNRVDLASDALDHLLSLLEPKYRNSENPQIRALLFEHQERQRDYAEMIRENKEKLDEYFEKQVVPEKEEERIQQVVAVATQLEKGGFILAALAVAG